MRPLNELKLFVCTVAFAGVIHATSAECNICSVDGWTGTAYRENGWFAYQIKASDASDGAAKISNTSSFILSPRYETPIRSIALKVKCSHVSPTRQLTIHPFVSGVENDDKAVHAASPEAENEYEIVKAVFDPADNVTAFRLSLSNIGSPAAGEWTVSRIFVFHGDAEDDEESVIPQIVNPIKTPENLSVSDFTLSSLALAAESVDKAVGYRFGITPYETVNAFEHIEAFSSTPEMSASSGWTRVPADSSSYGTYTGSSTSDGDAKALKVAGIDVEFISPMCESAVTEYSFMYRNGTSATEGLGNTISVWGRTDENSGWEILLPEFEFVTDTSRHYVTNALSAEKNVRQLKIVHQAGENPSKTVSFDSLRIASEGVRTAAAEIIVETASPEYEFTGLSAKPHEFRIQALSDPENDRYTDSAWSAPGTVDLSWAGIELSSPGNLRTESSGDRITVAWDSVENAEYYLVDVYVPGYPPVYLAQNEKTPATEFTVTVPEPGEYGVSVTACGPFGKAKSESSPATAEAVMGKAGGLEIEVTTPQSFTASWDAVAFAEGYEVKTYLVEGAAQTISTDYTAMPESLKDSAGNAWSVYDYFYQSVGTFNSKRITFNYPSSWIESCEYPEPVTEIGYSLRYSGGYKDDFKTDTMKLEGYIGGEWTLLDSVTVTEEEQTRSIAVAGSRDCGRIRFTLVTTGSPFAARNIDFAPVSLTLGETSETEVRSLKTTETSYTADSLAADGRFRFTVTPLPSGNAGLTATSGIIDLSSARPPELTGVRLSALAAGTYTQDFSALSSVTRESDVSTVSLPSWQLHRDGEAVEKIKFSRLGGNPSASGIYACCDEDGTQESYALGSLASSSVGTAYGIAFTNDGAAAVTGFSVRFDAMQRTFKNAAKSLALEYLVSGTMTNISAESGWKRLDIPVTAPLTAETRGENDRHELETAAEAADATVPPGSVLLLRWRDAASTDNPLTSIDDLEVKFTFEPTAMSIFLR